MAVIWKHVEWLTADANDTFVAPCALLLLDMCGAGGYGGNSTGPTGGSGGAASPSVENFPLIVTPGSPIAIRVAKPAALGQSMGASGYTIYSMIAGPGLLSPICQVDSFRYFHGGWGGNGIAGSNFGGVPQAVKQGDFYHNGLWGFFNAAFWADNLTAGSRVLPKWMSPLFMQGDGSRAGPSNPYSYQVAGKLFMANVGMGNESASGASDGAGGGGGGGPFGKGGAGGTPGGTVNGSDATGNGCGGGGAANGGVGGLGSPGLIRFKFPVLV